MTKQFTWAHQRYAVMDLPGGIQRTALMLDPQSRGTFREQAMELFTAMREILATLNRPAAVTMQTVFLQDPEQADNFRELYMGQFGSKFPVTTFVHQPPCSGAALAIEAWAISGESIRIDRYGSHLISIAYNGIRWVHCGGITPGNLKGSVYEQALDAFPRMERMLRNSGISFDRIVRTWLYLGDIVGAEGETQRYKELNRARTDFYRDIHFGRSLLTPGIDHEVYPASTGIGMSNRGMAFSCLALETRRPDVFLLPLENPQQTSAFSYGTQYSPQSPKFARAMAVCLGDYAITWVSGTASIVNSESVYDGDIVRQTEQTLENIARLIAPENFQQHGVADAGARLEDLAKVRVYVKRPEDFDACRAACERILGDVPAIYTVADVCRPELLVEIEGVAFSRMERTADAANNGDVA